MLTDNEFKDFIAELKSPWKTMGCDMDTAYSVISKFQDSQNNADGLELVTLSENHLYQTEIEFPDWQSQIEKIFIEQYGAIEGKQIFKKVIMRLFLLSRGTAESIH